MDDESSPLPAGPVCAWEGCGLPVPESRGTKPRRYCKRSCRQRAYEARKRREEIAAAVGAAVIRERTARSTSKNVTVTAARVPEERHSDSRIPRAAPAPSLPAAPAAPVRPSMPLPDKGQRRRRLFPPFPGASRERDE